MEINVDVLRYIYGYLNYKDITKLLYLGSFSHILTDKEKSHLNVLTKDGKTC